MKKLLTILFAASMMSVNVMAQTDTYNQINADGSTNRRSTQNADSLGSDKEIPKGLRHGLSAENSEIVSLHKWTHCHTCL